MNDEKHALLQETLKTSALARDRYMKEGEQAWARYAKIISRGEKDEAFATLKFCRDTGILTQQEYYERLGTLRDKFFAVGSKEWCKYTTEINDFNVSQITAAYDAIYDYAADKLSSISKKQADLYRNLDGYGDLTRTVKVHNYYENGGTLEFSELADLSRTNEFLREYSRRITAAKDRILASGVDEEVAAKLYGELLSMKPEEASEFAYLLGTATDEAFSKYMGDYAENMRLLDEISKNPFREEWSRAAQDVIDALTQAGFTVPETFSDIGKLSAESFGEDFLKELTTQMEAVKSQLTGWSFAVVPIGEIAQPTTMQSVFSPTYNLIGSGETDVARIQTAKMIAERDRMAGGY